MITPCSAGKQTFDEKDAPYIMELLGLEDSRRNKVGNEWKWRCIGEYCKKFPCKLLNPEEIEAAPIRLPEGI